MIPPTVGARCGIERAKALSRLKRREGSGFRPGIRRGWPDDPVGDRLDMRAMANGGVNAWVRLAIDAY